MLCPGEGREHGPKGAGDVALADLVADLEPLELTQVIAVAARKGVIAGAAVQYVFAIAAGEQGVPALVGSGVRIIARKIAETVADRG